MVCANELLAHMPVVMWFIRRHMRSTRTKGLSVPQFRALVRAERRGTLSDIASCLGTTLPTTSRLVSGLVAKGYLQRVESKEDRRCCQLSLTSRGNIVLQDAYAATREAMAAELQRLSNADCRQITESMRFLGQVFTEPAAS